MTFSFACEPFSIIRGNAIEVLKQLPTRVDCVITSPPYYQQRIYGTSSSELGRESSVAEYISNLVGIFKALNILYSQHLADSWMTLPNSNPMFRGSTPLAYILRLGQPGMMQVRQMLDARRGGQ